MKYLMLAINMIFLSSCSYRDKVAECIAGHEGAQKNPRIIAEMKRDGTVWPDRIKKYCTKLVEEGKWFGDKDR